MSCFHNRPTKPTFLPPPPREEEITTKDIEACYQGYKNLRWDIHEGYYFKNYLIKYVLFYNKENENSLRNNQQFTSMEETKEPPSSMCGETKKNYIMRIKIHSHVTLRNVRKHHMRIKNIPLKL